MPVRVSELRKRALVKSESGHGARVSEVLTRVLISSYPASPTVPTTGISVTQAFARVLVKSDTGHGALVSTVLARVLIKGDQTPATVDPAPPGGFSWSA